MEKTILVTGGSGFIGSNFILQWMQQEGTPVVNLDKLTYAGNPRNLLQVSSDSRILLPRETVCERELLRKLFKLHQPRAIVHFAAESHVDRSILGRMISSAPMFTGHFVCWKKRGRIAKG